MKVQILPDELVGPDNLRLLEAANDAGFHWRRMENFIDADKCVVGCSKLHAGLPDRCENSMRASTETKRWMAVPDSACTRRL